MGLYEKNDYPDEYTTQKNWLTGRKMCFKCARLTFGHLPLFQNLTGQKHCD